MDHELVRRVQNGDRDAFDLLVRKYQQRITYLVARYLRDTADVGDVVQEAFMKAYRGLARFRGESAFYTWMYRIAINTALPCELREAITLRELEGLSYEEIGKVMGCPIGTVRSRIFRAREQIDTQLLPLLDDTGGAA